MDVVRRKARGLSVSVWFQDEFRAGQQGTLTEVWAERGSRPTAVQQAEFEWVYVFALVCPETGENVELIAPTVNTHLMNAHLRHVSEHLGLERHEVRIMDGAGWHVSNDLVLQKNVTPLLLPPYLPEQNPVERPRAWGRQHELVNRVLPADEAFDEILGEVMLEIPPEFIQTSYRSS